MSDKKTEVLGVNSEIKGQKIKEEKQVEIQEGIHKKKVVFIEQAKGYLGREYIGVDLKNSVETKKINHKHKVKYGSGMLMVLVLVVFVSAVLVAGQKPKLHISMQEKPLFYFNSIMKMKFMSGKNQKQNIWEEIEPTRIPKVNNKPAKKETNPPVTDVPRKPTKQPEATIKATDLKDHNTKKPDITEKPEFTEEPVETKEPVITKEPIITEEPVVTDEPAVTKEPDKKQDGEEGV